MGQYHKPCSLDKGESLMSHAFGDGLKLMEFASSTGGMLSAFALFLAPGGRWHGDRVAIIGDYSEVGDLPEGVPFAANPDEVYGMKQDETSAVGTALLGEAFGISFEGEGWKDSCFHVTDLARQLRNVEDDPTFGPLFVVNKTKGQFLDPKMFGSGRNLAAMALRPCGTMMATALLLAVSNGRGGGDFRGTDNQNLVGSWGGDVVTIESDCTGYDITPAVAALIVSGGEYNPDWSGSWDVPGSLPSWLEKQVEEWASTDG